MLFDTSIFIASETGRPLVAEVPQAGAVSVVTLGELALGVIMAADAETRARRLATLSFLESTFEPLPIDATVAREWARVVASARVAGRRTPLNDCWIAATARVHDLAVVTQDADYDGLGVEVINV